MPWVVEQAKLKSTCEACRRAIPKGEWRFGKNHGEARWFHLRCGSRGAPEMFPPFAKQVQQILSAKPDESRPLTEVERAMVAKFDGKGLPVLADWLTSKGDPWGELITLRLAGEDELAIEHFDAHRESLVGDLPAEDLDWCDGVVTRVMLDGTGAALKKKLEALFQHRTAARLDTLDVYSRALEPSMLELISRRAPSTLVWLTLTGSASQLERLALPELQQLRLELNVEALSGLVKAKLPKLRSLILQPSKPLPVPFLEQLVKSPLFAQLTHFEFDEDGPAGSALTDAGLLVLLGAKTSHLKTTYVELAGRNLTPAQKALAQKKFAKSNATFFRDPADEPEFDEF